MAASAGDQAGRPRGGWMELLQPLLLLALDMLQWRMASQVLNAQGQLRRLIDALLCITVACVLLGVGLLSAVACLVLALEPSQRALALGLVAALCVMGAGLTLRWLRRRMLRLLAANTGAP